MGHSVPTMIQNTAARLRSSAPNVDPVEALLVDNGSLVTGGGITLGIDTMLHLLARLFGRQAAEETARLMEYGTAWKANARALPTFAEQYGSV
jgi:transcriptional regulator GlxA family with amidase domain